MQSDAATLGVNGDATLRGNVQVNQGDSEIRADEVEYSSKQGAFRVKGAVEFRNPMLSVKGSGGSYSQREGASFEEAQFELGNRPGHGTAQDITLSPDGRIDLRRVTYTTCPAQSADWRIRARNIVLDPKGKEGTSRDARVEFKGVPLVYLPWMSFPLGSERKSGFLFPSIGHATRSGFQVSVPYYLNLAPNYDVSLEPVYFSRRGLDAAGELRFLTERDQGDFKFDYLPNDTLANDDPLRLRPSDRSYLRLTDRMELPRGWRVKLDAENVSDPYYFEDFGQGPESTSIAFIQRRLEVSYRDEHWKLLGELQHFQTIDVDLPLADRPYARLPSLSASGDWQIGRSPLSWGFDSELVDFQRSTGVTGWRLDASPRLALDWSGAGWFMRPSASYRVTRYSLDGTDPGVSRSPSRSLPTLHFDAGLLFERSSGSQGQRRVTLEPRLLYTWTPYRNQDSLPLFDTALPDLNLVELFRTNRYVGADRVSDANQIAVGITSRLLNSASGEQYLAATLGQIYYFRDPRVALPGESIAQRETSDLIAQIGLTAYRNWNVNVGLQWNPNAGRSERTQLLVQYRPADDKVVNVGYRFQRGLLEQGEVSATWPIAQRWNVYAKAVYSVPDHSVLDRFLGVEYRACCWKLRTVARRFVSTRTGSSDTAIMLQLELTGLASVGTPADAFLEQAIRGYSPPRAANQFAR